MYARLVFKDFKDGLAAEARGFALSTNQARAALGAALAAVVAVLLADALNLERAYWSGISALVVSRTTYAASLAKGALRILGTIAGCALALVLIGLCINNDFAMLCLLFFSSATTVIAGAYRGRDAYAFSMSGFMVALISLGTFNDANGVFDFAFYRTFEISLGSAVAVAMSALVNPAASSGEAAAKLTKLWLCLAQGLRLAVREREQPVGDGAGEDGAAERLGRRAKALAAQLPQLVFEGRAEGGFGPEQTALASRLGHLAEKATRRLFLILDRLDRLEDSPAAPYAAEVEAFAGRLGEVARAVGPALAGADQNAFAALPVAPLEEAARALLDRHESLLKEGVLEGRAAQEALAWSEFMGLVRDLARALGRLSVADAGPGRGKKAVLETIVVRQAISAGLTMVLIPLIWKWFFFPGATQIGVTTLVALQADPVKTWRKGFLRFSGCLAGGSMGLFLLGTPMAQYLVPWVLTYFTLLFLFSYIEHGDSRCSYLGLQAGIALTVTLVQDMGPAVSLGPPVERLCSILAGLVLLNVISSLLGGYNPLRDLGDHFKGFLASLAEAMSARNAQDALADAAARLRAARRAQDILVWQGELKAGDNALLQGLLTDADRALGNAPGALRPPNNPDARSLLSHEPLRLSLLRDKAGESLRDALGRSASPWPGLRELLGHIDEDFESDAAGLRKLVRERGLGREARVEAASAVMSLKGLLEALALMAGRAGAAGLYGETPIMMMKKE